MRAADEIDSEEKFIQYILSKKNGLDASFIQKIIQIVIKTYFFRYSENNLVDKKLRAPVFIFSAEGDEPSFIENINMSNIVLHTEIPVNHYEILKGEGVHTLVNSILSSEKISEKNKIQNQIYLKASNDQVNPDKNFQQS
jgi:hypothetical protein